MCLDQESAYAGANLGKCLLNESLRKAGDTKGIQSWRHCEQRLIRNDRWRCHTGKNNCVI